MTDDDRTEFEAARRAGKALHQEQRLARRACDCNAIPGRPHSVCCRTELDPPATDMGSQPDLSPAAVKAKTHACEPHDENADEGFTWRCDCGQIWEFDGSGWLHIETLNGTARD